MGLSVQLADPDDDTSRLDSATVRGLPFGKLAQETRRSAHGRALDGLELLVNAARSGAIEKTPKTAQALRAALNDAAALEGQKTPGRGRGDAHYREVADIYRAAVAAGEPPLQAVMAAKKIPKSTAAKQVARAREKDYLPKTSRGRVGPITEEQR